MNSRVDGNGNFYAGNLLLRGKHLYSGSRSSSNNGPHGFPMYQPNYNLSSASMAKTNQMSVLTNSVHASPITSPMVYFANQQLSTLPLLVRDECSRLEKDANDFINVFQDGAPRQQCDELLQSIVDSSCVVNSTPVKEMKNSGKQRDLEIDLNKTPEQKPSKRRQRTPITLSDEKFLDLLNFPPDEGLSLSLYAETEENLGTIILDEATQKRHDELLKDFTATLSATISTPCGGVEELEKGSDQVIDLNKPLEQKTPKRRKHRPKVVTEKKPRKSSKPVMPTDTKETPTGKRKYVRKKLTKESTTPHVDVVGTKNLSSAIKTKSCQRVLNFDMEKTGNEDQGIKQNEKDIQEGNMGNFCFVSRPSTSDFCTLSSGVLGTSSDIHINHHGMIADNVRSTIHSNLAHMDKMMIPFRSQAERDAAVDPLNKSAYHTVENLLDDRRVLDHRKVNPCQSEFNNDYTPVQQYIRAGAEQFVSQAKRDTYFNETIELNSECSRPVPKPVSNIIEARGSKRGHQHTTQHPQLCSINAPNAPLLCQKVFQMDDRHRRGRGLNIGSSGIPGNKFEPCLYPTLYKMFSTVRAGVDCSKNLNGRGCSSTNPGQFTTEMNQAMRKDHIRGNMSTDRQNNRTEEISSDRYIYSVAHESSVLAQVNNYGSLITLEKSNDLQPFPHLNVPEQGYACRHSHDSMLKKRQAGRPIVSKLGSLASEKVQGQQHSFGFQQLPDNMIGQPVNEIIHQLENLKLNENVRTNKAEHNAIIPYTGNGAVVPYVESEYIKKRKPRPRVDLDPETERIWNLLMGKEGGEGLQGHEKDKEKWWEEERKVFRGRADSFIARMHLVQGDRRFSQWKGSVVDSVIGVFLTQNVSDHLSSSAFMSLAARFPLKSTNNYRAQGEIGTSIVTNESAACQPYPEDSIRWKGQVLSVPQFELPQISMNRDDHIASGTEKALTEHHSQIVEEEVISSQDSFDSMITQGTGGARSSSGSNSEAEDLIVSYNSSSIHFSNFTNAKEMETATRSLAFDQVSGHKHSQLPDGKQDSLTSEWNEIDDLDGRSLFSFLVNIENQQKQVKVSPLNSQLYMTPNHGALEVSEDSISSAPSVSSGFLTEKNMTYRSLDIGELVGTLGRTSSEENRQARSQETARADHSGIVGELSEHLQSNGIQLGARYEYNVESRDSCETNTTFSLESASFTNLVKESAAPAKLRTSALSNVAHVPANTEKFIDVGDRMPGKSDQIHSNNEVISSSLANKEGNISTPKAKRRKVNGEKNIAVDWDSLRKQVKINGRIKEKTKDTMDSIDYEAIRQASVLEISNAIRERGMNNMLAERIKEFLNRLVTDHGSIDLEWLREVPPDKSKDYLLSIRGLGLKSVECVRLLTLRHLAFPVDTNVGRIAVRLGWVPLQPLPESLQLHLLELYPVLESIQKYLWPRLCKLDQPTLYELHYQLITFGKVFCTKSKPNCNACPMRGECKHFASAFASARLSLPAPDERRIVSSANPIAAEKPPAVLISPLPMLLPEASTTTEKASGTREYEPIVEIPATPEPEINEINESDIEDSFYEDPDEIPTIQLCMEEFRTTLQNYIPEGDMSRALIALNPEAASIPTPKLKNVSRLRTEHRVYELPDSHPLLEGMDTREPDDPSPYLLAIWTPGETADSIQPPEQSCGSQDPNRLCNDKTCFTCNSRREANSQTVRGTLLVPCRTAMRGSFPLNGTYFQVNEMFADHESSLNPIDVPRAWLWNLSRRTVYFGTSVTTIFKGLSTEGIQQCFWRGFVCVRGFDQKTRAPRPLIARLHFPASKLAKVKNGHTE